MLVEFDTSYLGSIKLDELCCRVGVISDQVRLCPRHVKSGQVGV